MQKIVNVTCIVLLALVLITAGSCKKRKLNEDLFEEAKGAGLILYKNKDSILTPAGGSPHGPFKLKFNTTAASQFAADGKLPAGGTFEKNGLIVKEVYSGTTLMLYAIMKKDPDSKFAANGWLWGEYDTDGKVVYSVGEKGKSCTSCHSGSPNRDLVKSFDFH